MELGKKLRFLREHNGWTLQEASELTGISVSHLSAIEKGTRPNPSFSVVAKLAQAYGVPLSYFVETIANEDTETLSPPVASETPQAYQEIAKRLAEEHALDDPSKLLEFLAKYLRDRVTKYDDEK